MRVCDIVEKLGDCRTKIRVQHHITGRISYEGTSDLLNSEEILNSCIKKIFVEGDTLIIHKW